MKVGSKKFWECVHIRLFNSIIEGKFVAILEFKSSLYYLYGINTNDCIRLFIHSRV